ncbi:uncharacterized protein KY384_007655 [Bacidia gigantensis]|uniref:uncharacterized protein n=1 Tax=Bacidia gigantensis TaxID=2732470 RepID=UPI001D03CC10|nr:uncharacterized protein KY384_007655 [Bacidia gigantensis]KAG8527503.1 hypothetical protein KY384_007655 [Bacidia gigantensis]
MDARSADSRLRAGALAGTTVDLSLYPLDTIKTRLQSSQGFLRAGGFRGVYAGVGSAIVGSAPGAALFFVSYEGVKDGLRKLRNGTNGSPLDERSIKRDGGQAIARSEPVEHMIAASIGEIAACAVRVPTEVVKQRAQALQGHGSLEVLRKILEQRNQIGVAGVRREMYRGWSITIMREVPFTIIQFPIWEALKGYRKKSKASDTISAIESGLFGSIAGAIAAGLTTPLDVLKTRMMLAREKQSMVSMVRQILRDDGPRALISGLGPRIMWISAGGAVFLGSYQWAYNQLQEKTNV